MRACRAKNPEAELISLGIGDVTRPLVPSVIKALHSAVDEMADAATFRGYPPEYGYDFLREAIAAHYASFGVKIDPKSVYVSDGAKSDVGNLPDIFGVSDVLIPDPVYPVYYDSNIMAGNRVTFISADRGNGFLPMPDLSRSKQELIYICSPNNPTGAAYDRRQLAEWVAYAEETGSVIVFDSAYEAFVTGDYPRSIFEIPGAEACALEICSLSKTAGFTGTRCSWTVIPESLKIGDVKTADLWKRRQATKFNGVPYIVQRAAEAALLPEGYAECLENIDCYRANARVISETLDRLGIWYTGGKCSPYIWFCCPGGMKSWDFFDLLLEKYGIIGTPGAGFGKNGEGYFRLTSFGSAEQTATAAARVLGGAL